jgi:voltage-gated potassium channel Kch
MAAPDAQALARLRALQPALDAAVERAGLFVVRWSFRMGVSASGEAHATLAAEDAAQALTMPVFRAVAELALMLPSQE